MGQFVFHLGLVLGFMWLVFAVAGFLMEAKNFPIHLRGIALYELVAWSHFVAAGVYSSSLYRRYRQFFREDTRPQLLLTGAPLLWIVLAIPIYPLFIQAYIAFLCLPFYAAAITLGGISWSTAILTITVIVMSAGFLTGFQSSGASWLISLFSFWVLLHVSVSIRSFALWANLPSLLTLPVRFYAWSTPVWLLLAFALLLTSAAIATQLAWLLEPRYYPAQAKVWRWSNFLWLLLGLLFWGLAWAYILPTDFESKVAFTLVDLRLMLSALFLAYASTKEEATLPVPQLRELVLSALKFYFLAFAFIGFVGLSSNVSSSTLLQVLTISFMLSVAHSFAHGLGFYWWRKIIQLQRVPAVWWLVFFVWLISPIALFIQPLSPLAGVQGWLVPFCLLPSSFVQKGAAYLPFGIKIFIPTWWAIALVQVAWSGLLWWLERRTVLPQVEPKEERREWLTVAHPIWGWLARLEERICDKFANPLVTLQIRQQSRSTVLKLTMEIGVLMTATVLTLWLTAKIFPHPDLIKFVNAVFSRLPSLVGLAAWTAVGIVISVHDQKFALWLLGQKRVIESFVLAPLTKTQWEFGWWFPRVWFCLKAVVPYAFCLWLSFFLKPNLEETLTVLLVTASLPTFALAFGLMGLAEVLMRQWELFLVSLFAFIAAILGIPLFLYLTVIAHQWQLHVLGWFLAFVIHILIAAFSFLIYSRRIGSLRTPGGYERWIQLAEQKFRQVQRWRM